MKSRPPAPTFLKSSDAKLKIILFGLIKELLPPPPLNFYKLTQPLYPPHPLLLLELKKISPLPAVKKERKFISPILFSLEKLIVSRFYEVFEGRSLK